MAQRNTKQRETIKRVFEANPRPLKVAEVCELAKLELPRIGQATVYRAVNALVEETWLNRVELPGETAYYERSGLGHHHHFRCNDCGRVFDVFDYPGNLNALAPKGFKVESHEVVLYGRCDECFS